MSFWKIRSAFTRTRGSSSWSWSALRLWITHTAFAATAHLNEMPLFSSLFQHYFRLHLYVASVQRLLKRSICFFTLEIFFSSISISLAASDHCIWKQLGTRYLFRCKRNVLFCEMWETYRVRIEYKYYFDGMTFTSHVNSARLTKIDVYWFTSSAVMRFIYVSLPPFQQPIFHNDVRMKRSGEEGEEKERARAKRETAEENKSLSCDDWISFIYSCCFSVSSHSNSDGSSFRNIPRLEILSS